VERVRGKRIHCERDFGVLDEPTHIGFIDVRQQSDRQAALLARQLGTDIAVDLMGFTANSRPNIFAFRAAPLQVNYLGFPGTMGAPTIDYIIADKVVIPPGEEQFYDEQVVTLPGCYQVNDDRGRPIAQRPGRAEAGLPSHGFVFCNFNQSYKLTPGVFASWMRILSRVEGSVLWLLEGSELVTGEFILVDGGAHLGGSPTKAR